MLEKPMNKGWALFVLNAVAFGLLLVGGCSGYIQRIVTDSLARIGEPVKSPDRMITTPYLPDAELAVSWVGHATVLIQIHDKIIITDPLFTESVGILAKRYVGPAIDPSVLKKVDFTLISHLHFDHFSYGSLDELPKGGVLVVPDGGLAYTPDFGFHELKSLQPWESIERDGLKVTAVPVQHFSGRYGIDSRWMVDKGYTGYVIQYRGQTIFFGGDTGYNPELFKEIGRRFSVDVAILPIAPGSVTSLGSGVHVGPLGALEIAKEVGAHFLVPMHYGTLFYGSNHDPEYAIQHLRTSAAEQGRSKEIVDLKPGEQRILVPRVPPSVTR
jgi:N-acyl-phosphatidylethanolamine-hydrolysing phospholipase D